LFSVLFKKIPFTVDFKDLNGGIHRYLILTLLLSLILAPVYSGESIKALGIICLALAFNFLLKIDEPLTRILRYCGKYSYSLYYFHILVGKFLVISLKNQSFRADFFGAEILFFAGTLLLIICVSLIFSFITFRFFESRFINFAHK
jgi:peptidoglycan/LPS O-acetylase OafA/YrhL